MHPYAAEARSHTTIHLVLGGSAVLGAWGLHSALGPLPWTIPWWVDTPSVLGFYAGFWKLFDARVWRMPRLHAWKLVDVPNISGSWTAKLRTIYDEEPITVEGTVEIEQTWSRISIMAHWPNSDSYSVSAVLQTGPGLRPQLIYTFVNEPKATAVATMEMHRGTTWLGIDTPADALEGHYYTGRGRRQVGEMVLTRRSE